LNFLFGLVSYIGPFFQRKANAVTDKAAPLSTQVTEGGFSIYTPNHPTESHESRKKFDDDSCENQNVNYLLACVKHVEPGGHRVIISFSSLSLPPS
jgi:hypothetical protein